MGSIQDIKSVVDRLNDIAAGIAAAMEEQAAATAEIVRNVSAAAMGTAEVATSIERVSQRSTETTQAATTSVQAIEGIYAAATDLKASMEGFRV